ncbi:hypothetical protein OH784_16655 [Ectobacillus funiculus]|uniref:hypothetical protein n=1 Tax=Ectobacillus funiculus TaxID=137993 RepID=UPI00397CEB5C
MWAFDFPRRYEAEERFVRSESPEADILQDVSPGQRVAIWFHESGFIKGQFEGFQRSYALFLVKDNVMRIRISAIQAVAIL